MPPPGTSSQPRHHGANARSRDGGAVHMCNTGRLIFAAECGLSSETTGYIYILLSAMPFSVSVSLICLLFLFRPPLIASREELFSGRTEHKGNVHGVNRCSRLVRRRRSDNDVPYEEMCHDVCDICMLSASALNRSRTLFKAFEATPRPCWNRLKAGTGGRRRPRYEPNFLLVREKKDK
ncbi:hypothetical protein B0H13DRAFT_1853827 [Mycena leptocephala]|nr:hypothetical protein B0H13DRAFT_1853827 [Mycena leptocephala]